MKFTFRSIRKSCFEVKFRWISIIQGSQTIWKTNLTAKNFCDEFLPNAAANTICRITQVIPSDPFHWELISTCLFPNKTNIFSSRFIFFAFIIILWSYCWPLLFHKLCCLLYRKIEIISKQNDKFSWLFFHISLFCFFFRVVFCFIWLYVYVVKRLLNLD